MAAPFIAALSVETQKCQSNVHNAKKPPSKCTAKWCLDLFKLCNYSSNSECVLMTQSCILWLCWFKWPCLPMSDSAPTYILTNKKHWVFPCKFQPLVSVHFTVILKTKTDLLRHSLHVEHKMCQDGSRYRLTLSILFPTSIFTMSLRVV